MTEQKTSKTFVEHFYVHSQINMLYKNKYKYILCLMQIHIYFFTFNITSTTCNTLLFFRNMIRTFGEGAKYHIHLQTSDSSLENIHIHSFQYMNLTSPPLNSCTFSRCQLIGDTQFLFSRFSSFILVDHERN